MYSQPTLKWSIENLPEDLGKSDYYLKPESQLELKFKPTCAHGIQK